LKYQFTHADPHVPISFRYLPPNSARICSFNLYFSTLSVAGILFAAREHLGKGVAEELPVKFYDGGIGAVVVLVSGRRMEDDVRFPDVSLDTLSRGIRDCSAIMRRGFVSLIRYERSLPLKL
jgi:hypothetical protein